MTPASARPAAAPAARDGTVDLVLAAAFTACLLGWLTAAAYTAWLGLGRS